jgi:hypothetical protein
VSDYAELREPLDPEAPPLRGVPPLIFNGRIDPAGDEDRFEVVVTPGQVLRVRAHAADLGSALDASLRVLNAANNQQIANADDTNVPPVGLRAQPRKTPGTMSPDPSLDVTVPGGVTQIALVIRDLAGAGGIGYPYRLVIEPADPGFQLVLSGDPQTSVPRGGTSVIPIGVTRAGYNGPLTISVNNPPPGLSARPAQVADRQTVCALSVSAASDAAFGPVSLDIVGTAQGPNGPIVEKAGKLVVFAQQQNIPSTVMLQIGLAAAPAPSKILSLESPADPIEAVHGFPATVPIRITRGGDPAKGELTIPPPPAMPQGLKMGEAKIAADATEGSVSVEVDPGTSLGQVTLGLTAKGKFQDKDQTFGIPAVTLNVVRPAQLGLEAAKFEIKAGTTYELKGKLTRRGAFKEPVTLQINGLPEGLKAEPVTVAPEASEFVLKITADAAANATEAKSQLAFAPFKVRDKDYNMPAESLEIKVVR